MREAFIVESFATRRLKECLQQPADDERRHMADGIPGWLEVFQVSQVTAGQTFSFWLSHFSYGKPQVWTGELFMSGQLALLGNQRFINSPHHASNHFNKAA